LDALSLVTPLSYFFVHQVASVETERAFQALIQRRLLTNLFRQEE
jgi:hypothetical protein